jgi:glycosyltransferase involved in cell wall biosynthesis
VPSKTVVTIFDLTILRHPDIYPAIDVWYWRVIEPRTLRQADRVIAISQHTAADLERFYHLPPERIAVIHPCSSRIFCPAGEAEIARVRARYGLARETIIHVGSISRKKNLTTLVKAFARFRQATGFRGQLVLVGREYGKGRDQELYRSISALGLEEAVVFTGPVPDRDLPPLYSASALFVFPSVHEGFGIVALEAMACGVPVITTASGAIAEVVGEAALVWHNPSDEEELSLALRRVLEDADLRSRMSERGLEQARRFSCAESARQTLQLYREVAGGS